jgi:hypothetical protein
METPTTPEEIEKLCRNGLFRESEVTRHISPLIRDIRYEFKRYHDVAVAAVKICHFLGMYNYEDEIADDHRATRDSMYVILYKEPWYRFWNSRAHLQKWVAAAHINAGQEPVEDL